MLRSMFSGVSGIQSHMAMMDVIGNNIANVNTVGYKSGSMTFRDIMSQTMRGASFPTTDLGGTNPIQIGLGVTVGSVDANFSQGSLQTTNRSTDFAIQGNGMFILDGGAGTAYSRSGNFAFDSEGRLVNPVNGYLVQGWMADADGNFDYNNAIGNISIPITTIGAPKATTTMDFGGNLSATAQPGDVATTQIDVYDSQGNPQSISFTFTKTANPNEWDWQATGPGVAGGTNGGLITFDTDGSLLSGDVGPIEFTIDGVEVLSMTPDWGTVGGVDGLTQFSGTSTATVLSQNGYQSGSLSNFTVGSDGKLTGIFSNGQSRAIGQVALATFANASGLLRAGDNLWTTSPNSGNPDVGIANSGSRGSLIPGTLEMSNVDLSREFTNMIIAQRGFQSNSRTVTTADEMLQELVNLKR